MIKIIQQYKMIQLSVLKQVWLKKAGAVALYMNKKCIPNLANRVNLF